MVEQGSTTPILYGPRGQVALNHGATTDSLQLPLRYLGTWLGYSG